MGCTASVQVLPYSTIKKTDSNQKSTNLNDNSPPENQQSTDNNDVNEKVLYR